MKTTTVFLSVCFAAAYFAAVAAEFQNFGFDEPNWEKLEPVPGESGAYRGDVADVVPGWILTISGGPQVVTYNGPATVLPTWDPVGPLQLVPNSAAPLPDWPEEGYSVNFSLLGPVKGGIKELSQVGYIPADVWAVHYRVSPDAGYTQIEVNGGVWGQEQIGPYEYLGRIPGGYRGREGKISIINYAGGTVDILGFYPVPEPEIVVLLASGIAVIAVTRRWRETGRGSDPAATSPR